MAAVNKVLVIGGGFSGMAAAIALRRARIAVDLVEIDPNWRPEGAGITINGASLRAFETLGVYDEIAKRGFVANGVELCAPTGQAIGEIPTPKVAGSDVPGGGGIMRTDLSRILADATRASGVEVRTGCTYQSLDDRGDSVEVVFTDGTRGAYDLVVGADGVRSKLRETLFPEVAPPQYIGQVVWRAVLPRPEAIVRPRMWMGGAVKVGVNPVSETHMYMFVTEARSEKSQPDRATWPELLAAMLKPFPDPLIQSLIPRLYDKDAAIDYRALANLLVPAPWNRGRIVLIGDTVHATTPHLASGAGIGVESGIVLGEEFGRAAAIQEALDRFHARRWDRCRMVIQNSERLCRIEMENGDKAEHAENHARVDHRAHRTDLSAAKGRTSMRTSTESWPGRVALMVAHCAGMVDLVALPVWVGALIAQYHFSPPQAGGLATLFLVGAVVSSLFFAPRFNRIDARTAAIGGFAAACLAFLGAAFVSDFGSLAVLHVVAGLSVGCALSFTHGTIAHSAHPHRLFAIVGMALGVFAIVFLGATPNLIAAFGGPVLFRTFGVIMALAALAAVASFPTATRRMNEDIVDEVTHLRPAVWYGVAGVSCMALTQAMMFSFLERIGIDRGFGREAVTGVLIALGFVNLFPAPLAALLEKRVSPNAVLLVGPVVQAAIASAIAFSGGFAGYAAPAVFFAAVMIFTHTFAFGLLSKLDPTARALAATPAMLMVGAAIGPILGGALVQGFGYRGLGVAAIVIAAIAVSLFSRVHAPHAPILEAASEAEA